MSGGQDRHDALRPGSRLGSYAVEEVLGHGGFGIVYRARHVDLDYVVAIKEYLPAELAVRDGTTVVPRSKVLAGPFDEGLRRLVEEARLLIDFGSHPSIASYREFFRCNGTACMVMECVEGLSLAELLRDREAARRPFEEADLLQVAVPLLECLERVHEAGILHRDIKPSNILLRRADAEPVLIDFGAAKQALAESSRAAGYLSRLLAPHTPGYAAPEQMEEGGNLDRRADIYGVGAVLWRMVAGGNPPRQSLNPVSVVTRANAVVRGAGPAAVGPRTGGGSVLAGGAGLHRPMPESEEFGAARERRSPVAAAASRQPSGVADGCRTASRLVRSGGAADCIETFPA